MSNYLKGVVARGAGTPAPVTIRPSIGPRDIPPAATSQPPEQQVDATAPTQAAALPAPQTAAFDYGVRIAHLEAAPPTPASARPPDAAPAGRNEALGKRAAPDDAAPVRVVVERRQTLQSERRIETRTEIRESARPTLRSEPAKTPSEPQRVATVIKPLPVAPAEPVRRLPHSGSPSPATPPRRIPAASVPPRARTEPGNIHVRIGKVEIRTAPPQQAAPVQRRPSRQGLDDLALARNYFDRGWR